MSEVVLNTIVEKLVALEIALLKDNNPVKEETMQAFLKEVKSFRSEMTELPLQFEKSSEKNNELLRKITALSFKLDIPRTETVKHIHHFKKIIWVAAVLFIICFSLTWGLLSIYSSSQVFKANDIKYRYLKIRGDKNALNACKSTDSLYRKDEEGFRAKVELDEQYLFEQANLLRLASEKEKDLTPRKSPKHLKVRKGKS